jgi:GNAT superfamily N-acetyltransferase
MSKYTIETARPRDLPFLPSIELAAAQLLAGYAPASVLADTTNPDVLERARADGRVFVALADDVPVGFAHVAIDELADVHLEELDVHPSHGRRGLGTRLVLAVCGWAADGRYTAVTLTTFRDPPWNMPFYGRLGFDIIPSTALSPALRAVVAGETRRGLDPSHRVVMRRRCGSRH